MTTLSVHESGYKSKVQAFGGEEAHDYVNNGDYQDFEKGQGYLSFLRPSRTW